MQDKHLLNQHQIQPVGIAKAARKILNVNQQFYKLTRKCICMVKMNKLKEETVFWDRTHWRNFRNGNGIIDNEEH